MPCQDPTHTHIWPDSGTVEFNIQSCENVCDWCPDQQRGRIQKNTSNLRTHAQRHIANEAHLHSITIAKEKAGRKKLISKPRRARLPLPTLPQSQAPRDGRVEYFSVVSSSYQPPGLMVPPDINIDFAPASRQNSFGPPKPFIDQDALTPPDRGRRRRAVADPYNSGTINSHPTTPANVSSGLALPRPASPKAGRVFNTLPSISYQHPGLRTGAPAPAKSTFIPRVSRAMRLPLLGRNDVVERPQEKEKMQEKEKIQEKEKMQEYRTAVGEGTRTRLLAPPPKPLPEKDHVSVRSPDSNPFEKSFEMYLNRPHPHNFSYTSPIASPITSGLHPFMMFGGRED